MRIDLAAADIARASDTPNPREMIGGNMPPPLETHKLHIEELMAEAQQWLDGEPITTQGQADDVGGLLGLLRQARKGAEEQRAIEKKPHDDRAKEVQAAWKPIIDRCATAETVAKQALAPFLVAQEAEQRRIAEEARQAALRAQEAAIAAQRGAAETDLAAREEADRLTEQADRARRVANKADKATPAAAGMGRAVGLRTIFTPELTDSALALRHYRERRPEDLKAWLSDQANADVRAGVRSIPGFIIHEQKVAV